MSVLVFFPILPYCAQAIGDSLSQIGLVLAGYSYVNTMFLVPLGMLSDKMGYRKMLIAISQSPLILLGLMTNSATMFLVSLMNSFSSLLTAVIFHGVGTGNSHADSLCLGSQPNSF